MRNQVRMIKKIFNNIMRNFDPRFRFIRGLRGERVLELGCGTGNNCVLIKEIFPKIEIYGVDILDKDAVPAFVNYTKLDLDNTCAFPYPDNFFDAILFTHVIEHLKRPLKLGNEIHRVLKEGGVIFVEAPNWTSVLVPSIGFKREQHNPFNFFDDPTHLRPWSKQGLFEFIFNNCKLQVVKIGTVRNKPKILFDPFIILLGLMTGKRYRLISGIWNIVGWSIYGIGIKKL